MDHVAEEFGRIETLAACGESGEKGGPKLIYGYTDRVEHAETMARCRMKHLINAGHTIIDHELHIDPTATPKVWGWIAYI